MERVRGYVRFDPAALPPAWRDYFARQTLPEVESPTPETYHVLSAGLPDGIPPHFSPTLLEQMAWALLSRPHCNLVVYPLYVSTGAEEPVAISYCRPEALEWIASSGFLAVCRHGPASELRARTGNAADALRLTGRLGILVEAFSRALLSEETALTVRMIASRLGPRARILWWLARRLSPNQKYRIKRHLRRARMLFRFGSGQADERAEVPLARRRSWEPPFPRPEVDVRIPDLTGRIPVWIAMHWLELGGAEKFAVDLIRALPKDTYAVYVTTDLPSENPWISAIEDEVEEVLHFPAFLPAHMIGVFCEHYIRTRRLQLLHIHHAPRVYESLFHIRRFHPDLKVLDTLHILELPPHSGGYPEWTMQNFGVFIDRHHVISDHLKKFLMERWLVREELIDVVRINVDATWFDPSRVPAGELREKNGIPEDALVVGFVGRFTPQKRPLEFVRLAALLHERWRQAGRRQALHFVMVGGGTLLKQVTERVRASGLEDVVHLNDELADTRPVYRDCDVIAMPSENEGLAIVTYEAMAMATPVFFTDVGAQSELLESEQLVPPEMPVAPALADRIWPYLLDAEKREALGREQRAYVRRHHSVEESFRDMLRIYETLLGDGVPSCAPPPGPPSPERVESPAPEQPRNGQTDGRERSGGTPSGPRVAVAVVTYNHKAALLTLLEFLESRNIPTFLTENACSDGTREAVRGRFRNVSMLESPANLGGCGGFNCAVLAALSAGTDYILLIDDDALPVGDCIEQLANFLDRHRDYVFVAPAVYMTSKPDTLQEAGGGVDFTNPNPVEAWYRFHVNPQLPAHVDIDYASACCLMVRSEAIMRLGVMDWNYFIFSDDVDWSLRLRRAFQKKAACVTTAKVLHDFPWAKPFSPMRLYFFRRNGLYMLSRLRESAASERVVRSTVLQILRPWFYSRLIGDRESAHTLRDAFLDAWHGRYGKWRTPVQFPRERAKLDASYFRAHRIERVLVDITIEDFDADVVRVIRELGGNGVTVDVLCDAHRVDVYRRKNLFANVYGRRPGRLGPVKDFWPARRRRYDLTVTDAFMDPRRPASTSGRRAAFFHDGALYEASATGVWSCIAHLAALVLANLASRPLYKRFLTPPPPGRPPEDAYPLLERIGVRTDVGQPWARECGLPFAAPPVSDATVLRIPAPHAGDGAAAACASPVEPPTLGPGADDEGYREWCAMRDRLAPEKYGGVKPGPLFSVIVPLRDVPPAWRQEGIDSVRSQSYPSWELLLAGGAGANGAAAGGDERIKSVPGAGGEAPAATINRTAKEAAGDYLIFLDDGDVLDSYALAAFAQAAAAGNPDVLYGDEDHLDETRQRTNPVFKPDYSPDRLLAADYVHRPVALRRRLFEKLGGVRAAFEGCHDHDLLLRAVEAADQVAHVADVLYHVRVRFPDGRPDEARNGRATTDALERRGLNGAGRARVQSPSVSLLVVREGPTSERELRQVWSGCECLIAPDGAEPTPQKLDGLAQTASGDVLLIASSELRPLENWRDVLLPHLLRTEIGLVGGKLTYHDGRLYAAGLVLGIAGAVGRWHHGNAASAPGHAGWLSSAHEVSALPWQLLGVRRDLFVGEGGFDPAFTQRGFDVDLALRLRGRAKLRHLCLPATGGSFVAGYREIPLEPWTLEDLTLLWERWGRAIRRGDPYFNPNLSLLDESVRCADPAELDRRARGVFAAYDRYTVEKLIERFPGRSSTEPRKTPGLRSPEATAVFSITSEGLR